MKFSTKNQFTSTGELVDALNKIFGDQFEAKKAMASNGIFFENKEAFCRANILKINKSLNEAQEKILDGLVAFLSRDGETLPIASIFKKFGNLALPLDEKSVKTTQEILEISDDDFLKLYNLACEELNEENYETASIMFNFLNWLNPKMYYSLMNLGLAESLQGHYLEAQQIYEFCLSIFTNDQKLYLYAADNCWMMKEREKAQEYLEKCVSLANAANDQGCLDLAEQLKTKLAA